MFEMLAMNKTGNGNIQITNTQGNCVVNGPGTPDQNNKSKSKGNAESMLQTKKRKNVSQPDSVAGKVQQMFYNIQQSVFGDNPMQITYG